MGQRKKTSVSMGNWTSDFHIPCSNALPLLSFGHENLICACDDPASEHIKCICVVTYIKVLLFIKNYNVNVIVKFSDWIDCFPKVMGSIAIPVQLSSIKRSWQ